MQKFVALVLCLSLCVSTQAFILGDNLGGFLMLNMMRGGGGLFGGRAQQQLPVATGAKGTGASPNAVQMQRRPQSPFGNLFQLALLSEGGIL